MPVFLGDLKILGLNISKTFLVISHCDINALCSEISTKQYISTSMALGLGGLVGLFQHCSRRLIVLLPPNEFLHSSPEAPRTIQARETSATEGKNYYQGIQLSNPEFPLVLLYFTCLKAGTWDRFFHFPSEGRHAEDYSDTRKIRRLRPGSKT